MHFLTAQMGIMAALALMQPPAQARRPARGMIALSWVAGMPRQGNAVGLSGSRGREGECGTLTLAAGDGEGEWLAAGRTGRGKSGQWSGGGDGEESSGGGCSGEGAVGDGTVFSLCLAQ